MDASHPLAQANRWLGIACSTSIAAAKRSQNEGQAPVLLHKESLKVSSSFSGMGGAEFSAYLVSRTTGLRMFSVSHCDLVNESLEASIALCCKMFIQFVHIYGV
jgi:hypothetical protein